MQDQNHFFESEDHTMEFDTQDAQDAKIWSVLAYFGILFFLPLVAVPNSAYGKFHANQGLILLIFYVTLTVASWLVQAVLGIIPIIGGILSGLVQLAVSVCIIALIVFGIYCADYPDFPVGDTDNGINGLDCCLHEQCWSGLWYRRPDIYL